MDNLLQLPHLHLLLYPARLCYGDGSSLNLMNQHLLASSFSSAVSLPLSAFIELKGIQDLLWIRLQLKRILWLVWSSILTTETVSISSRMQASFLIICVFTGVAFSNSFNNFTLTAWLTGARGLALDLFFFFFLVFILFYFFMVFCLFVCFFKFYFIFKLYKIVLVLPNIKMNPPQAFLTKLNHF